MNIEIRTKHERAYGQTEYLAIGRRLWKMNQPLGGIEEAEAICVNGKWFVEPPPPLAKALENEWSAAR